MLEAHAGAANFGSDPWQFALTLRELEQDGVSATALRLLVAKGLAEHRRETTGPDDPKRSMVPVAHLLMSHESCFVSTLAGAYWAEAFRSQRAPSVPRQLLRVIPSSLASSKVKVAGNSASGTTSSKYSTSTPAIRK
jgi:hypothetical protein